MDDLAARGCPDSSYPSLLGYFWNLCPPGDPLLLSHPQLFRGLPDTFAAIRRYGFFEGAVAYRVDPARAAWVLGLTDARPAGS
jgi:hypothetical protein